MQFDEIKAGQIACVTMGRYDDYEIIGHFLMLRDVECAEAVGFAEPRVFFDHLVQIGAARRQDVVERNISL